MARIGDDWLCDTPEQLGCEHLAVMTMTCQVEGISVAFCRPCERAWKQLAHNDKHLMARCPRCAQLPVRQFGPPAPVRQEIQPIQGIIAEALERAMLREGVLTDVRRKVLLRLAQDEPWLGSPATEITVGDVPVGADA